MFCQQHIYTTWVLDGDNSRLVPPLATTTRTCLLTSMLPRRLLTQEFHTNSPLAFLSFNTSLLWSSGHKNYFDTPESWQFLTFTTISYHHWNVSLDFLVIKKTFDTRISHKLTITFFKLQYSSLLWSLGHKNDYDIHC